MEMEIINFPAHMNGEGCYNLSNIFDFFTA